MDLPPRKGPGVPDFTLLLFCKGFASTVTWLIAELVQFSRNHHASLRGLDLLLCMVVGWSPALRQTMVEFYKEVKLQNYVSRTIRKRRWGFLSSHCLCRWRNESLPTPGSELGALRIHPMPPLKIYFYWSRVDLQCCVSFRCAAKWSYMYMYIHMNVFICIQGLLFWSQWIPGPLFKVAERLGSA